MNAITSIYIPRIETKFNAEFIADVFERNDIAQVSRVYIEPYKSIIKNGLNKYNRAYIGIKSWHDTEVAFNFIARLRNPSREARLVYSDDNWWPVNINTKPNKLASNKRVLTLFDENQATFCCDDISTTAVGEAELEDFIQVDAEKTALLRSIISNFPAISAPIRRENSIDIDCNRELKASIYGYKNADEMDAAEAFDSYLHEVWKTVHEKWFYEQYIYDDLNM
jgi:hypothetical protein